jgi:hypothetical protein
MISTRSRILRTNSTVLPCYLCLYTGPTVSALTQPSGLTAFPAVNLLGRLQVQSSKPHFAHGRFQESNRHNAPAIQGRVQPARFPAARRYFPAEFVAVVAPECFPWVLRCGETETPGRFRYGVSLPRSNPMQISPLGPTNNCVRLFRLVGRMSLRHAPSRYWSRSVSPGHTGRLSIRAPGTVYLQTIRRLILPDKPY